jgi:hypothetical protein
VISSVVFGASNVLASARDAGNTQTSIVAADDTDAELEAAEERRRATRKKTEAQLLAGARKTERAELARNDDVAQTLGSPSVAGASLKERLGQ